jgi:hypothetical protein
MKTSTFPVRMGGGATDMDPTAGLIGIDIGSRTGSGVNWAEESHVIPFIKLAYLIG